MFALVIERDPLTLGDILPGIVSWIQDAGGFAMFGILLWLLLGLPRMRPEDRAHIPGWMTVLFSLGTIAAAACYGVWAVLSLFAGPSVKTDPTTVSRTLLLTQSILLTAGGFCACLAAGLPFLNNLASMRFRRVFALAKLSFKEALRRRVLYAFSGLLLVFLFTQWFVRADKPQDEVSTYVFIVFGAMSRILLFTACLLAAFSIPTDIRQQTIHTIVTKPVERFEVVLGRFLGFLALMTLVLVVVTAVSLGFVLRGVNPEAAEASMKAREPIYGEMRFENTGNERQGTNVGREWEYRSYITGSPNPAESPTACWDFGKPPAELGNRPFVRCEFTFDIYRTTKGFENQGISGDFAFTTYRYRKSDEKDYRIAFAAATNAEERNKVAEKFGRFDITAAVVDQTNQQVDVPGGLFRNAAVDDPERLPEWNSQWKARYSTEPPRLQVRVTTTNQEQYIGMARYDFYIRKDQPGGAEKAWFAVNFFKAAFGLWLRLALIIGLAVALSTYLSGVISLLVALVLYLGGVYRDFVARVGLGSNEGGGPMEAMVRLARRELTGPRADDSVSAADRLIAASDDSFRWVIRRILNVIPDVERFDLTGYVRDGFNIGGDQMLVNFLLLAAYLIPWAVLAYYLMKWREVASSN